MVAAEPPYRRILVAFDGSEHAHSALTDALELARRSGAAVRVVHVVSITGPTAMDELEMRYEAARQDALRMLGAQVLEEARAMAAETPVDIETELIEQVGRVADAIVEQARTWHADLLVLGTHGRRGVVRWVLGSDAELVIRTASVPVLACTARKS